MTGGAWWYGVDSVENYSGMLGPGTVRLGRGLLCTTSLCDRRHCCDKQHIQFLSD